MELRLSGLAVRLGLFVTLFCENPSPAAAHEGPDPLAHWVFNSRTVHSSRVEARLGPNGILCGQYELAGHDGGIRLTGKDSRILIGDDMSEVRKFLPTREFTLAARVSINQRQPWGGIAGVFQDNGGLEKGWILGYDQRNFYIGLSTSGHDDGDGRMTYLRGNTDYETGCFYHVVAVYDGQTMQLFVNGQLDASSDQQGGDILYPERASFVLGAYQDDDEFFSHGGRIFDISIYDKAARGTWVQQDFELLRQLTERDQLDSMAEAFRLVVPPWLQMATTDSMVVGWQTSKPASSVVRYGETAELQHAADGLPGKLVHHVRLQGLRAATQYFYRVESVDRAGERLQGPLLTFQTAGPEDVPFAFAVISDTQGNPEVAGTVASLAWGQRPNFVVHPGDLVSTGSNDRHWTEQFFPALAPLIGRVPIYPVLGNHEGNARNYYDYFQLPDPEFCYRFRYGNAEFFMVDSNRKVDPESQQYQWLERSLSQCQATWKFVVHHHPVYSSDENDYGDLWKTNRSTRGDPRLRRLAELYERYGVDVVWNGHIHSYERTWPVRANAAAAAGDGPVYLITGGGGGGLETPGPYRPFFQNHVRRGHHYCMVHINGGTLEFRAFDLQGRLFDSMLLRKQSSRDR
jgi:predicted phosphodiesterase